MCGDVGLGGGLAGAGPSAPRTARRAGRTRRSPWRAARCGRSCAGSGRTRRCRCSRAGGRRAGPAPLGYGNMSSTYSFGRVGHPARSVARARRPGSGPRTCPPAPSGPARRSRCAPRARTCSGEGAARRHRAGRPASNGCLDSSPHSLEPHSSLEPHWMEPHWMEPHWMKHCAAVDLPWRSTVPVQIARMDCASGLHARSQQGSGVDLVTAKRVDPRAGVRGNAGFEVDEGVRARHVIAVNRWDACAEL